MQHLIDPTNDYAFKQLFGLPENEDLLLHFLNSMLELPDSLTAAQLLNPISLSEVAKDKSHVLDVKARDQLGRTFQVEVQVRVLPGLSARMVHTWAELYQAQLKAGDPYTALLPVISVWILEDALFPPSDDDAHWHHHFQLYDPVRRVRLSDHVAVHTIELQKWRAPTAAGLARREEWVYFFKMARSWYALPAEITTPELKKAMAVLERISQKEQDYWRYKDQERAAREELTWKHLIAEAQEKVKAADEYVKAADEYVKAADEHVKAADEQVKSEQEKVKAAEEARDAMAAKLRALGVDPEGV